MRLRTVSRFPPICSPNLPWESHLYTRHRAQQWSAHCSPHMGRSTCQAPPMAPTTCSTSLVLSATCSVSCYVSNQQVRCWAIWHACLASEGQSLVSLWRRTPCANIIARDSYIFRNHSNNITRSVLQKYEDEDEQMQIECMCVRREMACCAGLDRLE